MLKKTANVLLAAATLALVANSVAALQTSNGGVVVCINKTTGVVRALNSGKCKSTEQRYVLGQRGATGPTGPQGPRGLKGEQGDRGPQGAPGAGGSGIEWFEEDDSPLPVTVISWEPMLQNLSILVSAHRTLWVSTTDGYLPSLPEYSLFSDASCTVPTSSLFQDELSAEYGSAVVVGGNQGVYEVEEYGSVISQTDLRKMYAGSPTLLASDEIEYTCQPIAQAIVYEDGAEPTSALDVAVAEGVRRFDQLSTAMPALNLPLHWDFTE